MYVEELKEEHSDHEYYQTQCNSKQNPPTPSTLRLLELLNKVWGLEGCPLKGQTMGLNCPIIYLALCIWQLLHQHLT